MQPLSVIRAQEGQDLLFGTDVVTIKAGGNTTAGSWLVFELRVPAGSGPPTLHRHAYSEVFYLLDGEFSVSTLDADNRLQTTTLSSGDTIAIPSMAWHTFKNMSSRTCTLLAIHNPPVMEELIHMLGVPLDDPLDPPAPAGPPSAEERQRFMDLIGQYMELLPPDVIVQ